MFTFPSVGRNNVNKAEVLGLISKTIARTNNFARLVILHSTLILYNGKICLSPLELHIFLEQVCCKKFWVTLLQKCARKVHKTVSLYEWVGYEDETNMVFDYCSREKFVSHIHTPTHTPMHTPMHTHIHTRTHTHTYAYTHMHICTHACTHKHTQTHALTCMHTYAHTHTHAHTCAHTRTHTHTVN